MNFEKLKTIKRQKIKDGDIFVIDLDNRSGHPYKLSPSAFLNPNSNFAFGRIIKTDKGSGAIIEIFNYIGEYTADIKFLTEKKRLFNPINVTSLCFTYARWKIIYSDNEFDKDDVGYKEITFLIGLHPDIQLWKGGVTLPIGKKNVSNVEEYTILFPEDVENRILSFQK